MKFLRLSEQILEVRFPDSYSLCDTAYRFSHFYEFFPFKGIYFSRDSLDLYYLEKHGDADHWKNLWSGANLPDYVFEPFKNGDFGELSPEEAQVVAEVEKLPQDVKTYVIFTSETALECRDHEIAHALWYTDNTYREKCQYLINRYRPQLPEAIEKLKSMGYNNEVLLDELHAYCGIYYQHHFKVEGIPVPAELTTQLCKLFKIK